MNTELLLLVSFSIHHFQQHKNITIAHLKIKSKENPDYMPVPPSHYLFLCKCLFLTVQSPTVSPLLSQRLHYNCFSKPPRISRQMYLMTLFCPHFSSFSQKLSTHMASEPHLLQLTFRMPRGEFSALFSALYNLYCLKFKG